MTTLLSLLEKDFSSFATIKDCFVKTRGEALPAVEVQRALLDKDNLVAVVDKSTLPLSKGLILKSLFELRKAGEAAAAKEESSLLSDNKTFTCSMHYFSTICTACHWMQFLCEYRTATTINDNISSHARQDTDSPQQDKSKEIPFTDTEAQNAIKQVLASMSGVITYILDDKNDDAASSKDNNYDKTEDDEDEDNDTNAIMHADATKSFDPRQVAVFAFLSISRLCHYVNQQPGLLGPIWKSLEEITAALQTFPDKLGTILFRDLINFVTQGVHALLDTTTSKNNETKDSSHNSTTQQQLTSLCKVLKFFLSRIMRFCEFPWVATALFRKSSSRLNTLLGQLSLLIGVSVLHDSTGQGGDKDKTDPLGEHLTQLAKKAKSVLSCLFRTTQNDVSFPQRLTHAILVCNNEVAESTTDGDRSLYLVMAGAAGKLAIHFQRVQRITTTENLNLTEDVLEYMLQACEDNLFVNIPNVSGEFTNIADYSTGTIVQETLASIIDCLVFIGSSCVKTNDAKSLSERFHFLLISWINRVADQYCHAISRELYFASICGYCMAILQNGNDDSFLALVVDLIFDTRTQDNFRRCLVEFVLGLPSQALPTGTLERLIGPHVKKLDRSLQNTLRKRKRSQRQQLSWQSLTILLPVLKFSGDCGCSVDHRGSLVALLRAATLSENHIVTHIQSFDAIVARKRSFGKRLEYSAFGLLQLVDQYCSTLDTGLSPEGVQAVARLLAICCSDGASALLCSRALEVVSAIAERLRSNMSKADCEQILGIFHKLLRSDSWPIRANSLSSFVVFATKVPSTYKGLLVDCLPRSMKKVFQSRMKKDCLHGEKVLANLRLKHRKSMVQALVAERRLSLSSHTTMHIAEGSYVIKMPTQANREAIVILPPGQGVLDEIEYMLDDDQDRPVYSLRRITASDGGCKLSLFETK